MEVFRIITLIFILCVSGVHLMFLRGAPLTLYNPCGLGDFYFYKISPKVWAGHINFGSFTTEKKAEVELYFKHNITIHTLLNNSTYTPNNHYILRFNGIDPDDYKFYVKYEAVNVSETYPELLQIKINNRTFCSELKEENVTRVSLDDLFYEDNLNNVCGRRSSKHNELISVMSEAQAGDWPWHVALFLGPDVSKVSYQCGGNIISRTSILTAAHCVGRDGYTYDPNKIYVVAGFTNYTDLRIFGRQILTAEKVITHPSFSDMYSTSDLAIVKVNKLRYTEYVQPICVWGPSYDKSALYGKRAMVVGFGLTEEVQYSKVLRASYTMVQYDSTCIGQLPAVYKKLLNEFTFCAGFGLDIPDLRGINPTNGDSGAGLVVPILDEDHKVTWYLRGVLSKCGKFKDQPNCSPDLYVVYTDVGPHYSWIQHHIL